MRDPEILHEEITRRLDMIIKNTNKPPTIYSSHEKIEPLSMVYTGHTENGISYCTGSRPADNRELMTKLNEVIERQNRIIDYLNEMVKK
jgi:polysaccharide deacetylase 2 family uncharacterized protein YibQ